MFPNAVVLLFSAIVATAQDKGVYKFVNSQSQTTVRASPTEGDPIFVSREDAGSFELVLIRY